MNHHDNFVETHWLFNIEGAVASAFALGIVGIQLPHEGLHYGTRRQPRASFVKSV